MGLFGPSREERLQAQRAQEARARQTQASQLKLLELVELRKLSKSDPKKAQWTRAQRQLEGRYARDDVFESSALLAKRLELLEVPEPPPTLEQFAPTSATKAALADAANTLSRIQSRHEYELKMHEVREDSRRDDIKKTKAIIEFLLEEEKEERLEQQGELWPEDVELAPHISKIEGIVQQVEAQNEYLDEEFREFTTFLRSGLKLLPMGGFLPRTKSVKGDPVTPVDTRITTKLRAMPLPVKYYPKIDVGYLEASHQSLVEFQLPDVSAIPTLKGYKYTRSTKRITEVQRSPAQIKSTYAELVAQMTLLGIAFAFAADKYGLVETLVFNGYVDTIDPRSGQPSQPCLVSVRVTRDQFMKINLNQVEAQARLKHLSASVSKSPSELTPVRPILDFDMFDPRFVTATDALSGLDTRPNLLELTPAEFEVLIQNLFEKMGLESRQTQASRDGGVDCIAYDNRPIFGGKVVIQAKRYKNTVPVSAVRDLYGTLQNEGASKGILVTTSGYGSASFEFIQNKPLELLEGGHLLHLLKEYTGIDAKIEVPEGWRDPVPDSGEDD